jgi:porphobilinogen synthase
LGADPVLFPTIKIEPIADNLRLDGAIGELAAYDWIVFTSVNGVIVFCGQNVQACQLLIAAGRPRVAAIGPATAEELRQRGVRVDLIPEEYVAERIVEGLGDVSGKRVLLPRARRARRALREELERRGATVDEVPVYDTATEVASPTALEEVRGGVDVVTFTSSSTVESFAELLGDDAVRVLAEATTACIGPVTAATVEKLGGTADIVARTFTTEGLVDAIASHFTDVGVSAAEGSTAQVRRPRRLRRTESLRRLVREVALTPADLVYPIFVDERDNSSLEIASMPGMRRARLEDVGDMAQRAFASGIPAVLLFGIAAVKDAEGSGSYAPDGIVQRAIGEIKSRTPDLAVMTDACLCEYTDHGHCGIVNARDEPRSRPSFPEGYVLNDETLEVLQRIAVSHAVAGADIVAPSGMMDGMVGALRTALDSEGFDGVGILSYAVKYASAFYGPFRDAAEGVPKHGDRRSHQMDMANAREALREVQLDVEQGADIVMVKPALSYLDVLRQTRDTFPELPLAAYNVSGEYSMVKAAAAAGWLDEREIVLEMLTSMKRAGADMIITYHAQDVATWLNA